MKEAAVFAPHSILCYTSFLFGLPGYYGTQLGIWIGPAFLTLMACSILHHAKNYDDYPEKLVVDIVDAGVAHVAAAGTLWYAWQQDEQDAYVCGFYATFAWSVYAFYFGKGCWASGWRGALWHGSVHVAGATGASLLIVHESKQRLLSL